MSYSQWVKLWDRPGHTGRASRSRKQRCPVWGLTCGNSQSQELSLMSSRWACQQKSYSEIKYRESGKWLNDVIVVSHTFTILMRRGSHPPIYFPSVLLGIKIANNLVAFKKTNKYKQELKIFSKPWVYVILNNLFFKLRVSLK